MSAVVLVCAPYGASWRGIDWIAIQRRVKRRGCSPLPFRRVLISKKNRKTRRLEIPAMKYRAMQALHLRALEPIVETTVDSNSYGFRPELSTVDAAAQRFGVL
jgi:RNA-directed DNA polymerase